MVECCAVPAPPDASALTAQLAAAGFVSAGEEAELLLAASGGDATRLQAMVERRLTGEPLAWITGGVSFCGVEVRVDPGVYVPRWQSEALALRAVERLPERGVGVEVCTGSGAISCVLRARRPAARVVASDVDPRAVACAAANGVEVYRGDLFAPLPAELRGHTDVVVAVVPYVPTAELPLLQRDTFAFESTLAYDGGDDGTAVLRRVLREGVRWLRQGGAMLLELGGDQHTLLRDEMGQLGYGEVRVLRDEDGDVRGVEATLG